MVDESKLQDQLERLERVWRILYAPVLELLRPGLTDEQIDELMVPTGLTLPDELRVWWRWHDSAPAPGPDLDEGRKLGPGGWLHLPLHEAIDLYNYHEGFYHKLIATGSTDIAELAWRPGLFPFSHRVWQPNHVLAADTLVPEHEPAQVIMKSEMGIEQWAGAESFGEVIHLWIELLESGRYHVEDDSWQPKDPLFNEEPRLRWLL